MEKDWSHSGSSSLSLPALLPPIGDGRGLVWGECGCLLAGLCMFVIAEKSEGLGAV